MSVFKQFKDRNAGLFEEMGVDPDSVTFRKVMPTTKCQGEFASILEHALEKSTTLGTPVDSTREKRKLVSRKMNESRLTAEALERRVIFNTLFPVIILAACYTIFVILYLT
ncbi:hypothetical protein GF325_10440 [Candidatus Bathyarchaeota archaeon]|nr:hypothetical protein [Candidatus Bathyarchaeota archaeon]